MSKYYLNYLDELESEAIYILREVWAQFENPVILFSGGKDSILVTHLAQKAFYPAQIPFPLIFLKLLSLEMILLKNWAYN
jgi:sulfate adenylyltransferase subunit 2